MSKQRLSDAKRIHEWTDAYEKWLATQVPYVVCADIQRKHDEMATSPFVFLRATYYAWAKLWPAGPRELTDAPEVVSVGDLHLENFGTWRDNEGRLAWGINDFDEASMLPYTNDLVRLATSVALAYDDERIRTPAEELSHVFLTGYRDCLELGGRPVVFGEGQRRLQEHILSELIQDRKQKGEKKNGGKKAKKKAKHEPGTASEVRAAAVPTHCEEALAGALPAGEGTVEIRPRVAGVGSLGRPRFVATKLWSGGPVMREAKARVASATAWARGPATKDSADSFELLLRESIRSPDPFLHLSGRWVIRRLAADTDKMKLEVKSLPRTLELELAALMGAEVANVHLATRDKRKAILRDLKRRPRRWLVKAARDMAALIQEAYKAWRKGSD